MLAGSWLERSSTLRVYLFLKLYATQCIFVSTIYPTLNTLVAEVLDLSNVSELHYKPKVYDSSHTLALN
jgi:hypothetical protein